MTGKIFYKRFGKFFEILRSDFFYGIRIAVGYTLGYLLPFIPKLETESFEKYIQALVKNQIKSNPETKDIINQLTDEQIIYKKGEGPEFVFKKENGSFIPRIGGILMAKYFIAKRFLLLQRCLGKEELTKSTFLDVGTTSGLFLRLLEKKGTGLNISPKAVEHTIKHGIESHTGSADKLPFADKSFDHIICFQTLEHLENPLMALHEFKRVARKSIFLTIPKVNYTKICDAVFSDRGMHRWHVFEFSKSDFKKILERLCLKIVHEEHIKVIGGPKTISQILFYLAWNWASWFEGYSFYQLQSIQG